MKTIISVAIMTLASSSAMAANCAKNPNHSSCQGGDTTVIIDNSGLPTVVNGDGTTIGKAFAIGFSRDAARIRNVGFADVRLTFDTLTEGSVGYSLRFYSDGISTSIDGKQVGTGIYRNGSCTGVPDFVLGSSTGTSYVGISMAPFFSDNFIPIQHPTAQGSTVSLVRLSQGGYGYLPSPYYRTTGSNCIYYAQADYEYIHEVLEGYEVGSQFIAPITFVPSEPN